MIILKTLGIALLLILAAFSILCGLLRWLSKQADKLERQDDETNQK